jgi:hypothetical protein
MQRVEKRSQYQHREWKREVGISIESEKEKLVPVQCIGIVHSLTSVTALGAANSPCGVCAVEVE